MLWELLAGRKLFRGKSEFETLKNVSDMEVPAPSSLRPDVPPELDRIIARVLARDPAERYATGQEMAEALEGVLEALHHQARALPDLLHELFGAELASRQIPTTGLAAEMLAAATTETSSAVPPRTGSGSSDFADYSVSLGTAAPVRRKPGWMSYTAAAIGTATLLLLLVARGGGGRSQGATLPAAASVAVVAPQAAAPPLPKVAPPVAPREPAAAAPAPASDAPADDAEALGAKPAHRAHWSGKGRIARGLSVDPFAEAASRVGR